jgi:hypothetical protein
MSAGRKVPSGEASPGCVPVALPWLVDQPRRCLADLFPCPGLGVVVDDDHLVDHAGLEEARDDLADRVALGVGHENHGDSLAVPHELSPPPRWGCPRRRF